MKGIVFDRNRAEGVEKRNGMVSSPLPPWSQAAWKFTYHTEFLADGDGKSRLGSFLKGRQAGGQHYLVGECQREAGGARLR